jgi:hypothetical protein
MNTDAGPILENRTRCLARGVSMCQIHHRAFPEIQVEGLTPESATRHLVDRLTAFLDREATDRPGEGPKVSPFRIGEVVEVLPEGPVPGGSPSRLPAKSDAWSCTG